MLEEALVAPGVEGLLLAVRGVLPGLVVGEDDVVRVGQPPAGVGERLAQMVHHEADGVAVGPADEAAVGVAPCGERERGVVIVVERAEALAPRDLQSESLRDPQDGQVAELLDFILFHHYSLFSIH